MTGAAALLVFGFAGAMPAHAQRIAAMVNGEPITNSDIDQRIRLHSLSGPQNASRKDVLEELINDKVKIREGKKFGLNMSASDIDAAYANMGQRMRMTTEQLNQTLQARGIRPETLKARIKADMTWSQLVRGRFQQSLLVGEKEVVAVVGKPEGSQASENFEYQLRTIIMVVPRGSSAATIDSRRKEAEALRSRIASCEQAVETFTTMRSATIRPPVTRTSGDLPAPLRATLDKTPIGQLTAPEVTKAGIEMVALCSKKASTADTPAEREARDKLMAQRFEAKSNQYLKDARRTMMIEYR